MALGRGLDPSRWSSEEEKLDLIYELWDSLEQGNVSLTSEQMAELDRRLDTADADIAQGRTWEEIKQSLARGE